MIPNGADVLPSSSRAVVGVQVPHAKKPKFTALTSLGVEGPPAIGAAMTGGSVNEVPAVFGRWAIPAA